MNIIQLGGKLDRAWKSLRISLMLTADKRGTYLKKKDVFFSQGENLNFVPRKVPLYPKLIKIGENVNIGSGTLLITHDGMHTALNGYLSTMRIPTYSNFREGLGCIEIGNNVTIGARSIVYYNVKIGDNVIISAGSVITGDIPSNCIARGNPAKPICTMDQYMMLRSVQEDDNDIIRTEEVQGSFVDEETVHSLWDRFNHKRK